MALEDYRHPNAQGVAIESGGITALVTADSETLTRVNLVTGGKTNLFFSGVGNILDVAVEAGGTTALVASRGGVEGKLQRVNLSSGTFTTIASGFSFSLVSVKIEAGGTTALLTEGGGGGLSGRLLRVNLSTGLFEVIVPSFTSASQVFVEAGGTTALVGGGNGILRVDLATKTFTRVTSFRMERFAVEAGGATAIVLESSDIFASKPSTSASIYRVNLSTGGVDILVPRALIGAHSIVLEGTGATALVTTHRVGTGELLRFNVPAP